MHGDPQIFYRRRLPHYQPPNEIFHVTFRLAGSLPAEAVQRLKQEREETNKTILLGKNASEQMKLRRECGANYYLRFDEILNRAKEGPSWLGEDLVAAKVAEIVRVGDGKNYDLLAYCLMPNHVHLLAVFWQLPIYHTELDVKRSSDCSMPTKGEPHDGGERTEVRATTPRYVVTDALRKLKGVSAYECNKLLDRNGAFWHHESYDHIV